jgi:hypothetical protein
MDLLMEPDSPKNEEALENNAFTNRARRLLGLKPGDKVTAEAMLDIPDNQMWKLGEAQLLDKARQQTPFKKGTGSNRAIRRQR